jgi:hypothetical protein
MSGSAVLPPKRPPRSPLKLQLPGAATPAPPAPEENAGGGGRPKLSLNPAPPPPKGSSRPTLKLPGLTAGVAGLSLAIPQKGVGRYSKALDRANEDDEDGNVALDSDEDDGDDDGGHGLWAAGEQERMAGELLEVINGAPAGELEDELSGRTRRPRSNSRFGSSSKSSAAAAGVGGAYDQRQAPHTKPSENSTLLAPPAFVSPPAAASPSTPSSSAAASVPNPSPRLNFYGDHVRAALQPTSSLQSTPPPLPHTSPRLGEGGGAGGGPPYGPGSAATITTAAVRRPSYDGSGAVSGTEENGSEVEGDVDRDDGAGGDDSHDGKLDISPQTIKDLGRLGEGASGEVRRVLHIPSQMVMAKKVGRSGSLIVVVVPSRWLQLVPADHHDLAESESPQTAPPRAALHEGLHPPQHRPVLWGLSRSGTLDSRLFLSSQPLVADCCAAFLRTTPRLASVWSFARRVASNGCTN